MILLPGTVSVSAENFLKDGGLETFGQPDSPWQKYAAGAEAVSDAHSGTRAVRVENREVSTRGIRQKIVFDPPFSQPLRVRGWVKLDPSAPVCSEGKPREDFNIYIDALYDDGTPLWAVKAEFPRQGEGWQQVETLLIPAKPIREMDLFVLFRDVRGAATFDDFVVEKLPLEMDGFQATGGVAGTGSLALRVRWNAAMLDGTPQLYWLDGEKKIELSPPKMLGDGKSLFTVWPEGTVPAGKREFLLEVGDWQHRFTCDVTGDRKYTVWTESSMNRVYLYSLPGENRTAELAMARNEYEGFQIAVLSGFADRNVKVECSDLTKIDDPSRKITCENIRWRQVGYLKADQIHVHCADPIGVTGGFWPDVLLPRARGEFLKDQTVAFWVNVYAPEGTAPGEYAGTVTLRPENAPETTVPVRVRVWDFTLDREGPLANGFAMMEGPLEILYKSPVTRQRWNAFAESMLAHRLTPEGDITRTSLPDVENLKAYRGRGLGKFNLLNMVAPREQRFWTCNSPVEFYTPEKKEAFLHQLKPLVEQLRKEGLSHQAYVYTFDECNEAYFDIITEFFGMIKANFPEVATFTTARFEQSPEKMAALNVDWLCPLSSVYHRENADRCRDAGKQVWSYVCCGPGYPYANIMFHNPLIEARLLGWQSWEQRYDGLLYWGVNIWFYDTKNQPFDPEASLFPKFKTNWTYAGREIYGDGILFYPGTDEKPLDSIRLENLRDGLEDYEYLVRFAKTDPDAAVEHCHAVMKSPREFTRDANVLSEQRRKIAEALEGKVLP
ncbi:MAG: DUF4091 domain-containing protein [Planctomycetia bacterium]|nr:DUF4091 domain-containing protein [Planctomycetia bacterium]